MRGKTHRPAVLWKRGGKRRRRQRGCRGEKIRFVEQDERVSVHEWGELHGDFNPWARGRRCRGGDGVRARENEKRSICGLDAVGAHICTNIHTEFEKDGAERKLIAEGRTLSAPSRYQFFLPHLWSLAGRPCQRPRRVTRRYLARAPVRRASCPGRG